MTEYDDQGRKIVEPEIVTDEKFRSPYSDAAFHSKLLRFAGAIGREGLRSALILYYTLQRKDLPVKTRAIILGALGYLILPADVVPDIIPMLGFTDDIGILAAALAAVAMYVDDASRAKADAALERWLGAAEKLLKKKEPQGGRFPSFRRQRGDRRCFLWACAPRVFPRQEASVGGSFAAGKGVSFMSGRSWGKRIVWNASRRNAKSGF